MDTRRDQIIEIIKSDLIGPDPIDALGRIQENGEEILYLDPPIKRYIAGILFPRSTDNEHLDSACDSSPSDIDVVTEKDSSPQSSSDDRNTQLEDDAEEAINLSNAYKQSAISITTTVKDQDVICIHVSAGKYEAIQEQNDNKKIVKYYRNAINWDEKIALSDTHRTFRFSVKNGDESTNLVFLVTFRYRVKNDLVYTFSLINDSNNSSTVDINTASYFQVEFSLSSEKGFSPFSEALKVSSNNSDYLSNRMLYRNVHSYAIGHGCGTEWTEENGIVNLIQSSIFPQYEIKPVVPNTEIDGVDLEMEVLMDPEKEERVINGLRKLCEAYSGWICGLEKQFASIEDKETARRHIDNCKECLARMEDGVDLLEQNPVVMKAFQMMNKAMLMQQLHYNLPLQKWFFDDTGNVLSLDQKYTTIPQINNKRTWFGDIKRYGNWRPFQLVFVLINLRSMYQKDDDSRKIVDLIWFPTGGGKTEAYLGLSAYTIFIRRLLRKDDDGTAIIMRYTLRLLTSQQYERASSLICACEIIRQENEALLGEKEISIGLWVGDATSPNKMADAASKFDELYNGQKSDNPFVVLKCPWCGAQMGVIIPEKGKQGQKVIGYYKERSRVGFRCGNDKQGCVFSKRGSHLPLYVIDEDIYKKTPTLIIGTVDKFAMLPFRPEAQVVFGIKNGTRVNAPDLIIQDELHLISGPLGSMVGHYETLIGDLCSYEKNGKMITPKIIASTATISRAAEQCNALYACGSKEVKQFPPSGLDAGDSFFAKEDVKSIGRRYVGILASGSSSVATTMIRLYASLLYAAKEINVEQEIDRDPYWTNIGYFNSIRELGQAETWINADIDEYLQVMYRRRAEDKKGESQRRYIYRHEELTSRIRGDRIPLCLQNLSIKYPPAENGSRPIDICLATNMISVGVDVPRLGLMTVAGQPKTTSEYIQATSRVGRSKNAPGLIFIVYNPSKPRDKSHYENFVGYHSKIYCNVEPTSVTPFSAPLRERALHALIIGLLRLEADEDVYSDPPVVPNEETRQKIKQIILERVLKTEKDEFENTEKRIDKFFDEWQSTKDYKRYSAFSNKDDKTPLMFSPDVEPKKEWNGKGFLTPTSMRSVDVSCNVSLLRGEYPVKGDENE